MCLTITPSTWSQTSQFPVIWILDGLHSAALPQTPRPEPIRPNSLRSPHLGYRGHPTTSLHWQVNPRNFLLKFKIASNRLSFLNMIPCYGTLNNYKYSTINWSYTFSITLQFPLGTVTTTLCSAISSSLSTYNCK